MGISRKDMLMGLMHSAEQGQKMREGSDMAKINENQHIPGGRLSGRGARPILDADALGSPDMVTMNRRGRATSPTLVSPPGKPEVANPDARTGFGSDRQNTINLGEVPSSEVSSVNQHGNVRRGMNQDIVSLPDQEEQRRRENSEAEMRRRSAPDAAINREPVMASEVRNESNASHRGKIILETLNSILFQK